MIRESVTITLDKITVSYSDVDLSLTPELEARLRAYWADRIRRIEREVLLGIPFGAPLDPDREGFGTFSGNVPEREQVPQKAPICAFVIPTGNT